MTKEAEDSDPLFSNKNVPKDVKRKVLAEKRAYETVKLLLEQDIDGNVFAKSVYFLSDQHYQDIIEERAILKLCGYPLCDNTLENVAKQQYRISRNRVYDLTQRKHFCSDRCYKASEHVKKQIPTSPIWLRDPESIQPVDLDLSGVGSIGEEVAISSRVAADHTDEIEKIDIQNEELTQSDYNRVSFDIASSSNSSSKSDAAVKNLAGSSASTATSDIDTRTKSILEKVMDVLKEWITDKTLVHMGLAEEKIQIFQPDHELSSEDVRKMRKMKLVEAKLNQVVSGDSAPTSDPKILEQDAMEVYTRRVQMFYEGRISQKEKVRFQKEEKETIPQVPVQPRIDSKNQVSIRRNILHQKLAKVSQELFPRLPLAVTARDLKALVNTFNLTSTNVVLKTNEYPIVTVAIIHLMSGCVDDVRDYFDQSGMLLSHVLLAYKTELSAVQRSVDNVIDKMMTKR